MLKLNCWGLRRSMKESEREPVDGWGPATLTKENEREPVDGWVAATLTKENERELWGVVVLNEGKRNEIASGCSTETKSNENETLKFTPMPRWIYFATSDMSDHVSATCGCNLGGMSPQVVNL